MDANSIVVVREASTYVPVVMGALITGSFIVLAAVIGYKGGLHMYFKKREHEQIMRRYLEEGIDKASEGIAEALRVLNDNYTSAYGIFCDIRERRRINTKFQFDRYSRQYLGLIPFYRIHCLVGDDIFWEAARAIFVYTDTATDYLDRKLRQHINEVPPTLLEGEFNEIQEILKLIRKDRKEYHRILMELQAIASILEKERTLDWEAIAEFKNRPDVKESTQRLKQIVEKIYEKLGVYEQKE